MEHVLATGGPNLATSPGRFDPGPVVMLIATLAAIRFLFGITMTGPVLGAGILAGVTLGWAVTAWGIVTPTAVGLLLGALAAGPVRRWQAGTAGQS